MSKTVVATVPSSAELEKDFVELENNGVSRQDISVLAPPPVRPPEIRLLEENQNQNRSGLGMAVGGTTGFLAGLVAVAIPGVGPLLAMGPIAAAFSGAAIGAAAGGVIGGLTDSGVPEEHARQYADNLKRGECLIVVSGPDDMVDRAEDVLRRLHVPEMHEKSSRPDALPYDPNEPDLWKKQEQNAVRSYVRVQ